MIMLKKLFDQELATRLYGKELAEEAAMKADRATAEKMIQDNKLSLDDIARYVLSLSMEELREIEANSMQMV